MRRSMLILFCLGAVLLAVGCGSSSGGSSSHQLSEAAFKTRANHICTKLAHQEQADASSTSKAGLDRNLGRIDSALSQLQGLNPPAKEQKRYRTLLSSFKSSVAYVQANEARLVQLAHQLRLHPSDTNTQARYEQLVRPFVLELRDAATAANRIGLAACANGLTGGSGTQQPSP